MRYRETGTSIVMPFQTTSASSHPRIFGFWREPGIEPRTEILDMLAAGRTGADVARIFRVHRATISRIAAEARAMVAEAMSAPRGSAQTEPASPRPHEQRGQRARPKAESLVISTGCSSRHGIKDWFVG